MGKKIKESQTKNSQSQGVCIPALTCHPFLENSEQDEVFAFCCEDQTQDHINDGTSECNDDETLMLHAKQSSWQLIQGKVKSHVFPWSSNKYVTEESPIHLPSSTNKVDLPRIKNCSGEL